MMGRDRSNLQVHSMPTQCNCACIFSTLKPSSVCLGLRVVFIFSNTMINTKIRYLGFKSHAIQSKTCVKPIIFVSRNEICCCLSTNVFWAFLRSAKLTLWSKPCWSIKFLLKYILFSFTKQSNATSTIQGMLYK